MPSFERHGEHGVDRIGFAPAALVMAGWTGRDRAAVDHHIAELAALGVPGPSRIPTFYRLSPALLAGSVAEIWVLGEDTSGEVEVVLFSLADGLYVGLGSDHTDRAVEAHGVALAKQLCRKPTAAGLWRLDEVSAHWVRLILRAYIFERGERRLTWRARSPRSGDLKTCSPPMGAEPGRRPLGPRAMPAHGEARVLASLPNRSSDLAAARRRRRGAGLESGRALHGWHFARSGARSTIALADPPG